MAVAGDQHRAAQRVGAQRLRHHRIARGLRRQHPGQHGLGEIAAVAQVEHRRLRRHEVVGQRTGQAQLLALAGREQAVQSAAHDLAGVGARQVGRHQRQFVPQRQRHHRPVQRPLPGTAAGLGDQVVGIARALAAGALDIGLALAVELFHGDGRAPALLDGTRQRGQALLLRGGVIVDLAQQHVRFAGKGGADRLGRGAGGRAAGGEHSDSGGQHAGTHVCDRKTE